MGDMGDNSNNRIIIVVIWAIRDLLKIFNCAVYSPQNILWQHGQGGSDFKHRYDNGMIIWWESTFGIMQHLHHMQSQHLVWLGWMGIWSFNVSKHTAYENFGQFFLLSARNLIPSSRSGSIKAALPKLGRQSKTKYCSCLGVIRLKTHFDQ